MKILQSNHRNKMLSFNVFLDDKKNININFYGRNILVQKIENKVKMLFYVIAMWLPNFY